MIRQRMDTMTMIPSSASVPNKENPIQKRVAINPMTVIPVTPANEPMNIDTAMMPATHRISIQIFGVVLATDVTVGSATSHITNSTAMIITEAKLNRYFQILPNMN